MEVTTGGFLNNTYVLFFTKSAILILLVLYGIFALIIVRQVDLMSKTLITPVAPVVKLFALLHAFFVLGLIFLALAIL